MGDIWLEEILTPQGPRFVRYNWKTDQYGIEDEFRTNLKHYVPVIPDEHFLHALTLPGGLREYGTTTLLLREMEKHALEVYDPGSEGPLFRMFIRGALASWVLDALFRPSMEKFASIFAIVGPSESGKGRFLSVARALFYRPLYFLKTSKIPSLFRPLNAWKGTLILDEADEPRSDESSEYIEFLNARATGVPIPRFSTDLQATQVLYSFGNTILALRKAYEDDGFTSRSVKQRAESSKKNDIPLVPPPAWVRATREIQEKLLLWRLRNLAKIRRGELWLPQQLALSGVTSFRVKEAFLILKAISEEEPAVMEEAAQIGAELQKRLIADKAHTKEGRILNLVFGCLDEGWAVAPDGEGFHLTGTVRVRDREGIEDSVEEILRAGYVHEQLDRAISQREIVALWKGMGQDVRPQARHGSGKVRSVLIVREPRDLDRHFARFVPDYRPQAGKFGKGGLDSFGGGDAPHAGTSATSGTGGKPSQGGASNPVPLVPVVPPPSPSRGGRS